MWHHLHRLSKVISSSLALYDMLIDLSRGDVILSSQGDVEISFVISKVKVDFSAIIEDEAFAMLCRSHGPGIDIHVAEVAVRSSFVAASCEHYGSILIEDTFSPMVFNSRPVEEAITPFPMPLMTPPDTRTYFMMVVERNEDYDAGLALARREERER